MSAVDVIAEAINDDGWTCDVHEPHHFGECPPCRNAQVHTARVALAALTAAGYAVVELPKPDMTGEHQFSESEGHAVANFFSEDCEEWVMSCCGEVGVNGLPPKMSPDYARSFAGRVLAAATHAEAVRDE